MDDLLRIKNLRVYFDTEAGWSQAVEDGFLRIRKGETVGLVGESGCGKTVTALSILRLLPIPPARIASGRILFKGQNLLDFSADQMRDLRGKIISMIFQEPMAALNPVYTIGDQIAESIRLHLGLDKKQTRKRVIELLGEVELPSPEEQIDNYPHQLSGGMAQRAMIAMALACQPELLIADEPTTALDVTVQAQILSLFSKLKKKTGIIVDEYGRKIDKQDTDGNNKQSDEPKNLDEMMFKLNDSNKSSLKNQNQNNKKFTPITSYKPKGNLVYDDNILNSLEDKFN